MGWVGARLNDDGAAGCVHPVPNIQKLGTLAERPEFLRYFCHGRVAHHNVLGGQDLAAFGTTPRQDLTAIFCCHTRTEAVTAGANEV